jgi:hypothetical protein
MIAPYHKGKKNTVYMAVRRDALGTEQYLDFGRTPDEVREAVKFNNERGLVEWDSEDPVVAIKKFEIKEIG